MSSNAAFSSRVITDRVIADFGKGFIGNRRNLATARRFLPFELRRQPLAGPGTIVLSLPVSQVGHRQFRRFFDEVLWNSLAGLFKIMPVLAYRDFVLVNEECCYVGPVSGFAVKLSRNVVQGIYLLATVNKGPFRHEDHSSTVFELKSHLWL